MHGGTPCGAVAFHAFESIDDSHAPERLHLLRSKQHIVVGVANAVVVLALVAPSSLLLCTMKRSAKNHVLDRHSRDHDVVRLQHCGADDECIRIDHRRCQANWYWMKIVVEYGDELVPAIAIQINERHLLRLPLRFEPEIFEVLEGNQGIAC